MYLRAYKILTGLALTLNHEPEKSFFVVWSFLSRTQCGTICLVEKNNVFKSSTT